MFRETMTANSEVAEKANLNDADILPSCISASLYLPHVAGLTG